MAPFLLEKNVSNRLNKVSIKMYRASRLVYLFLLNFHPFFIHFSLMCILHFYWLSNGIKAYQIKAFYGIFLYHFSMNSRGISIVNLGSIKIICKSLMFTCKVYM